MDWKTQLPGKIKIRVNEDSMGNLCVSVCDDTYAALIAQSNEYDHCSDIYLQNSQDIQSFLESYPSARYRVRKNECDYKIGKFYYCINDNNTFYIDTWEYRHMVGGQSD